MPEITLEDVRRHHNSWLAENNRVVIVTAPEKEGVEIPNEAALETVLAAVEKKEDEPLPPCEISCCPPNLQIPDPDGMMECCFCEGE